MRTTLFLAAALVAAPLHAHAACYPFGIAPEYPGNWDQCLSKAVDLFSDQPEPAETVVTAAFQMCIREENAYLGGVDCSEGRNGWRRTFTPSLLARVMTNRAKAQIRKQRQHSPRPAIDYNRM